MKMMLKKATNTLKKFITLLICIYPHFAAAQTDNCETPVCISELFPPGPKNGVVTLTVYYDNDNPCGDQANSGIIQSVCRVHDHFKKNFELKFVVGSSATVDKDGKLTCYADCEEDLLEACVIAKIKDPTAFMKCNNNGGDVKKCVDDQDKNLFPKIDECAKGNEGVDLLTKNGQAARDAKVAPCWLPDYAFDDVYDFCVTKNNKNDQDIINYVCKIMISYEIDNGGVCPPPSM